jgi:hypothetical protein
MLLEAVHFLVEIGNPRHTRLSGMHPIRSYDTSAKLPTKGEILAANLAKLPDLLRKAMELSRNLHARFSK